MALPTPTPTGPYPLPNGSFEDGSTGWILGSNWTVVSAASAGRPALAGSHFLTKTNVSAQDIARQGSVFPALPGMKVTVSAGIRIPNKNPWDGARVGIEWYNSSNAVIGVSLPNVVNNTNGTWITSSVTATAPTGATGFKVQIDGTLTNRYSTRYIDVDNVTWDYTLPVTAKLTSPGASYDGGEDVPFRVAIEGLADGVTVTDVKYYTMVWDDVSEDYIDPTLVATETVAPFAVNVPGITEGRYGAYAVVTLSNGLVLTTNSSIFTVGEAPEGNNREFKGSNSYTYLVAENFFNLASSIPSTALVTGAEIVLHYGMDVLVRSKDMDIEDPSQSNPEVAFAVVNGGTLEAVLLSKNGESYSVSGAPMTATVPLSVADFAIEEQGISGDRRWTVYESDVDFSTIIGASDLLFGQGSIDAATFVNKALGIRFYPNAGSLPSYADSGEAVYRIKINSIKLRVYFDAGSVEYYFASPSKYDVIKGELVAGNVLDGKLVNGDAEGVLQLSPELDYMLGTSDVIQAGWTIHSAYPVSDLNQIGTVKSDMRYNALPTYTQVLGNRSRYQFITANFYGDPDWKSMYGVNGVDRAFAYNGEYFYKIVANPDADNDKPRHVANHHSHLALGYAEGRVDVSVVGEPYNFDGAKGASSWAFGDSVTGLLPLSGTMLGVFCQKSVWGLSGTTVDNFSSQVISPKMGAIEYTVTDMGFPVYANVYGIYTLSQTQEYGDYKGTPLSQDISPWLRKRLKRDATASAEVVTAWPVRAKNQYKLAFSDGYVLTMTMNFGSQQVPTFSKQKYFYAHPDFETVEVDLYARPSIVPAAISSELDHTGEERIHVAPKTIEQEEEYYSTSGGGGSDPEPGLVRVMLYEDSNSLQYIDEQSFPDGWPDGFIYGAHERITLSIPNSDDDYYTLSFIEEWSRYEYRPPWWAPTNRIPTGINGASVLMRWGTLDTYIDLGEEMVSLYT